MYSVYNDDAAFEKMFVKKKYESNLLFPGLKGHPTKTQVREVLQYLNTHNRTRQDRLKIAALKSVNIIFSILFLRQSNIDCSLAFKAENIFLTFNNIFFQILDEFSS